jgi:hypothetical protein
MKKIQAIKEMINGKTVTHDTEDDFCYYSDGKFYHQNGEELDVNEMMEDGWTLCHLKEVVVLPDPFTPEELTDMVGSYRDLAMKQNQILLFLSKKE